MQTAHLILVTLTVLSSIISTQAIELYRITRGKGAVEEYFEKAEECIKMKPQHGAVFNPKSKKLECQPLLSEDPCPKPREWLVLVERKALKWYPQCAERKTCGRNRLPFGARNGPCVKLGDPSKCEKDGEVVRGSVFGYGVCTETFEGEFDNLDFDEDSDATESFSTGTVQSNSGPDNVHTSSKQFTGWG